MCCLLCVCVCGEEGGLGRDVRNHGEVCRGLTFHVGDRPSNLVKLRYIYFLLLMSFCFVFFLNRVEFSVYCRPARDYLDHLFLHSCSFQLKHRNISPGPTKNLAKLRR